MVGFTPLTTRLTPVQLYHMLDELYSRFDSHLDKLGLYKMDTVGDAFVAIGGLPGSKINSHATAAVQLGLFMLQEVASMNTQNNLDLNLRIGESFSIFRNALHFACTAVHELHLFFACPQESTLVRS